VDGNQPDVVDINTIPISDYSDIDMTKYRMISLVGSRGCINKCTFCTARYYSKIFRQRKAELIAGEMDYHQNLYNISNFQFADNLMNGNLKEFRRMCELISGKGYRLFGQMAFNSRMVEDDFKYAAKAGVTSVAYGLESGSEIIRKDMGKSFTNETVHKTLGYLTKHGIKVQLMMIIGWPTEDETEFQRTLGLISEIADKKYNIEHVNLGPTCSIDKYNELYFKYDYEYDEDGWIYNDNTMKTRVDRWFRLRNHCLSVGLKTDEKFIYRMTKLNEKYAK
jgi:radical SAM superfamily enzyme YgiQ (UPF0313 family)